MSDGQFAALLSVLGAIGASLIGTLKWAVTRITKALDDNTTSHGKAAEQMAVLSTKIDFAYGASREVKDFIAEERSGVHDAEPETRSTRRRTEPRGVPIGEYGLKRGRTHGDDR